MTAPINNSFDFAALASLRSDARAQDPAALKETAKQFESLFTKMLLKSMRDANKGFGEDSMFGSQQADFYQDMFDDQMAMHLSKGKGLGLADMLVQQLTRAGLVNSPDAAESTQPSAPLQPVSSVNDQQPLSKSKADFVRTLWPHAQRASSQLGVDPHALVAQAALETGWGKSVPPQSGGASSFNLFGIKAGSNWAGATTSVPTLEFEDGVAVRRVERFRAYASPADSFNDYAALIRNNPRYENAVGAGGDVATFASALQQGGYATDPNYAQKVVAVAAEVRSLTSSPAPNHAPGSFKSAAAAPLTGMSGLRRF
jgi:flagellar protein FlgJ